MRAFIIIAALSGTAAAEVADDGYCDYVEGVANAQAAVQFSPELSVGPATKLFDTNRPGPTVSGRPYDVSPTDGRLLVVRPATTTLDRRVTVSVVLNSLRLRGLRIGGTAV